MFHRKILNVILVQILAIITILPKQDDCLIITSVLAGDKKFKTISFDSKFLKPLKFEKEMPSTEFRRHRTVRPPKFDIDLNIPISLPLEDEYPQEEYKKPVENNIFFQTSEINEPSYDNKKPKNHKSKPKHYQPKKPMTYRDEMYSAASQSQIKNLQHQQQQISSQPTEQFRSLQPEFDDAKVRRRVSIVGEPFNQQQQQLPLQQQQQSHQPFYQGYKSERIETRSDVRENLQQPQSEVLQVDSSKRSYAPQQYPSAGKAYKPAHNNYEQPPEFIPGGYINLNLKGPTGGPTMQYEDYDREKWAQQLSQTAGAMPYPILNYHQLQNYYGGLGTFTNGLADNRYESDLLLDKLVSGINQMKNKLIFGR